MWERKEARDCLAARQSIENEKRLVETGQQKLKRFQAKVCTPTCQINVYPHIQLIHKGCKKFHLRFLPIMKFNTSANVIKNIYNGSFMRKFETLLII